MMDVIPADALSPSFVEGRYLQDLVTFGRQRYIVSISAGTGENFFKNVLQRLEYQGMIKCCKAGGKAIVWPTAKGKLYVKSLASLEVL